MAEAIKYFATDKGLGFGVAIIIVTIIVRLIILPLAFTNHGRQRQFRKDECPQTRARTIIKHASKRQQLRRKLEA